MYRAVVTDLDGTLLNNEKEVSEFSKEVINKIREKGVKFFIATGRSYPDTKRIMETIGIKVPLITSNGARINDENGETIYANDLEKKYIRKILEMDYKKYGEEIFLNMYSDNVWYITEEMTMDPFKDLKYFLPHKITVEEAKQMSVSKFFFIGDHEHLMRLEKELFLLTDGNVNIAMVTPECLEVFDIEVHKGNAIKILMKKEKIKMSEVVAFGDGFNDYEMLKMVGKGYVMGNALYQLKEALPDNEIIGTCDSDAEAKKLIELFL